MPELPEVETVRAGLSRLLPGRAIKKVWNDSPKQLQAAAHDIEQFVVGAKVTDVKRRAKVILIELNTKYSLVIHLKMTGQMVFRSEAEDFGAGHPNDSLIGELPDRSTHVYFTFKDGSKLFFNDQRKFGWVKLIPTVEVPNLDFFQKVGPEPLSDDFTPEVFVSRVHRRDKSGIKSVLLDQTILAGIGNIYADESLWAAKIHPQTKVQDVPTSKLKTLHAEIRKILQLAIDKGGSSNHTYVDAEGRKGSYMNFANVFRREGEACPRCGTTIIKTKVAGRGTHTCPQCQKAPVEK